MDLKSWTSEYALSRYLRKVPNASLEARYKNLIQNLWSTDHLGRVQRCRSESNRIGILRLLCHVCVEERLRGCAGHLELFDEGAMIAEATASYTPPILSAPITSGPIGIVKFGKREHIRPSFEHGIFRIAPASEYKHDASLNAAQADDELKHFTVTPNESIPFKLYMLDASGNEVETKSEPLELFRYMNVPNFYVWCSSNECDLRMLRDFEADAFIIIRKPRAFIKRMFKAVADAQPSLAPNLGPVRYYDPYTVQRHQLIPVFSKNIKYLYQSECRFAWSVPAGTMLAPFLVELGSLNSIAKYHEIAIP